MTSPGGLGCVANEAKADSPLLRHSGSGGDADGDGRTGRGGDPGGALHVVPAGGKGRGRVVPMGQVVGVQAMEPLSQRVPRSMVLPGAWPHGNAEDPLRDSEGVLLVAPTGFEPALPP